MEEPIDPIDTVALAKALARVADDTQAYDIVILDLRGRVSYTDAFVLCTGRNRRHVLAIAEAIRLAAKRTFGVVPRGLEGLEAGQWVLVDLGDVVVHVFDPERRGFYDLDGLWSDAPRLEVAGSEAVVPL